MAATPRLIFNDEGSNFLHSWDGVTPDDLRAYRRRREGTQVDMVAYCAACGDYVTTRHPPLEHLTEPFAPRRCSTP